MEDISCKDQSVALAAIGRRIQIARNKRKISVAKLSAKTAISIRFIEHIEAGAFSKLPGRSHVLGFTRSICRELGLDPQEVIQAVKSEMYPSQDIRIEQMSSHMEFALITKIQGALNFILKKIS